MKSFYVLLYVFCSCDLMFILLQGVICVFHSSVAADCHWIIFCFSTLTLHCIKI